MRYLAILGCLAVGWCADLTTGQGARLVIGQQTFTAQARGASESLLGGVSGLAYARDMLFVADSNKIAADPFNHRVLIFRDLSSVLPRPTDEIPQTGRCPVCLGVASVVLGQPDFTSSEQRAPSQRTLRSPTAVATDGSVLAVADTDHNRVLIWRSIPATNQQPADVVIGQPDFQRTIPNDGQGFTPTNKSVKGPQGVWIQHGRLFIADTGNNRVLIYSQIPTANGAAADLVLGQPDFNTFVQPDLIKERVEAKPNNLLTPVSVSSDGVRLYVADLGHNRVLIWNSIPTRNQAPADIVVGQPTMESAIANNSPALCEPLEQTDSEGKPLYPSRCRATLEFPRFALSDGRYLFVADGGNDRILVFNEIPARNGQPADAVLGQFREDINQVSDSADPNGVASAGVIRTPLSLAWDGTNLFASDPYNRRILVFTLGERLVPNTGVRNSASREVYAVGGVTLAGTVKANLEVAVKISDRQYKYKAKEKDDFPQIINGLVEAINAGDGDPEVLASPNVPLLAVVLTSRVPGPDGNQIEYSSSVSGGVEIQATAVGSRLAGGQDAAKIAPGTIVSIFGQKLSESEAAAPPDSTVLPRELAGVQVYFDGIRAPLYSVSPAEIRAQVPVEVHDTKSINAFVRTVRNSGEISVTSAIAVPIVKQNPGIFAEEGTDPRPGVVLHSSSQATGTVSVDGTARAGDVATVVIRGSRNYSYTVKGGDTLAGIRDGLIELINQDPEVEAHPAGAFTRIRLRARVSGPEGSGLVYTAGSREGDQVIMTATTPSLCCANEAGAPVTEANPALPGETIIVYATGLGLVKPEEAREAQQTGTAYNGPAVNDPLEFVSSLAGGKTANVLLAGLKPGTVGVYEVHLELNSDLPSNPKTQLTIAQDIYVSNIVTFPVVNPSPSPQ